MWFQELFGFEEETPEQVRENLVLHGGVLHSNVNGRSSHSRRVSASGPCGITPDNQHAAVMAVLSSYWLVEVVRRFKSSP